MSQFLESLESRTLLSAAPHKAADTPTITADKAAILAAKAQITHDINSGKLTQTAIRSALASTRLIDQNAIKADLARIKRDKSNATLLAQDKLTLTNDRAKLKSDLVNIQTSTKTALAGTRATLVTDHAALKAAILKLAADRRAKL